LEIFNDLIKFYRDAGPTPYANTNENLYGYHPFFMGLDAKNQSYGVYLQTTYPLDVFLQPDPNLITYRILGGDIKLYFFAGPTADMVWFT